jgi:hypothetical protein
MAKHSLSRWLPRAGAGLLLLLAASCVQMPPAASYPIPPVPPQQARIWFYRDLAYYGTMATPFVRLNGVAVGVSQTGGAFYRDIPPGHYHISVDSYGVDFNQTRDVDLAPGQEIYAKVVSLDNWIEGGGGRRSGGYHRDTFYVWLYPPEAARPAIAQSWFFGGSPPTAAFPSR